MFVSISKSGRRLLTSAEYDETIRIWDAQTCQEVLRLSCPPLKFSKADFTPDGKWIVATATKGGTVIWSISADPSASTGLAQPLMGLGRFAYRGEVARTKPSPPFTPDKSWKSVSIGKGEWKVERDELVQSSREAGSLLLFGPELSDYNLSFRGKSEFGTHGFKAVFHHVADATCYQFALGNYGNLGTDLSCFIDGKWDRKEGMIVARPIEFGKWYEVRLEVRGSKIRCLVDGKEVLSSVDERFTKGRIGFSTWDAVCRFRDIVVTSPDDEVLWKGIPELPTR